MHPSGRAYLRPYERLRRAQQHAIVEAAIAASGGRVLWSSGPSTGPLFLAVQDPAAREYGLAAYVFRASRIATRNRPSLEHKLQVRYGNVNDAAWRARVHPVGFDPTGLDVTVVLGVEPSSGILVGLDPALYDPLPMGISIFWKDADVEPVHQRGWSVWERENRPGVQRSAPRAPHRVETLIGFAADRLFDYIEIEQEARALGLDPPLRFRAAERILARGQRHRGGALRPQSLSRQHRHALQAEYRLEEQEIFEIIGERSRLAMAVRGGVAEHHLGKRLRGDPAVRAIKVGQAEGPPDFHVTLQSGARVTVECKNAARVLSKGLPKVEVQKTRASKGDPASRFYRADAFDVIAACLYGPTRSWDFKYKRAFELERHRDHTDRIAPIQRIDDTWSDDLVGALGRARRRGG